MSDYSGITAALVGQITSSMDPMQSAIRNMMVGQAEALEGTVDDARLERIGRVRIMLSEAVDSKAPPSVIKAYEDMLSKITKARR